MSTENTNDDSNKPKGEPKESFLDIAERLYFREYVSPGWPLDSDAVGNADRLAGEYRAWLVALASVWAERRHPDEHVITAADIESARYTIRAWINYAQGGCIQASDHMHAPWFRAFHSVDPWPDHDDEPELGGEA